MSKIITGISFAALLGLSGAIIGIFAAHAEPGGRLAINEVFVDFSAEGIIITGENFDTTSPEDLTVTLGTLGDISDLCIADNPQTITCDFESTNDGLPVDGDYLLTVSASGGQNKPVTYDLTIGAVGPEGPQGPAGIDGEPGIGGFYTRTEGPFTFNTDTLTATSSCENGDNATGGGYRLQDPGGGSPQEPPFVIASEPFPNDTTAPRGWAVTAFTATVNSLVELFVTALCVDFGDAIPTLPT